MKRFGFDFRLSNFNAQNIHPILKIVVSSTFRWLNSCSTRKLRGCVSFYLRYVYFNRLIWRFRYWFRCRDAAAWLQRASRPKDYLIHFKNNTFALYIATYNALYIAAHNALYVIFVIRTYLYKTAYVLSAENRAGGVGGFVAFQQILWRKKFAQIFSRIVC